MPTYEYRCPNGHEFERFQKMTESPRARCPVCGRNASRQISGGAGLIFKGSGFYITDYGKDGKGPRADKDSEAKLEASPKSEGAEAKAEPAAKGEKAEPQGKPEKSEKGEKSEKKSSRKKASQ